MANTSYAILAVVPVVAWFLYSQLYNWRYRQFSGIPEYLKRTLLFGHLESLGAGYKKVGDTRRHHDYMFEHLWHDAKRPELFFVDLRPVNRPMTVISSHHVAEQITRSSKLFPYSVTKSPTVHGILGRLIGAKSIITQEGEFWKSQRKLFNAGFAHQHLLSLLPAIISKSTIFMDRLDALAESGEEFAMDPLTASLTFDIIGEVVAGVDLNAQDKNSTGHEIVYYVRELTKTFTNDQQIPHWLNPSSRIRRIYHSYHADAAIKRFIQGKFDDLKAAQSVETKETRDRSVLALALKDIDELDSDSLQSTADQIKSFFFAGHDTTSILIQWLFYALSIHPRCLEAVRAEHKAIFGDRDPREVLTEKPEESLRALSYTSACIKEALRLWPPASTARLAEFGKGFKVRLDDGQEVCLDGTILYICQYLIQRDPKVYGETANDFVPERWLGDTDTTAARKDEEVTQNGDDKIPISAWRPFERGPRNCIGQELANIEARVILACVMRRYDFIKVGAGEVELDEKERPDLNEKGQFKTKSELFNSQVVTAKPFDKCRMRIKMHKS